MAAGLAPQTGKVSVGQYDWVSLRATNPPSGQVDTRGSPADEHKESSDSFLGELDSGSTAAAFPLLEESVSSSELFQIGNGGSNERCSMCMIWGFGKRDEKLDFP